MAQKKQLIIVAVLGVILVGVLVWQFTRGNPAPPPTQPAGKAASKPASSNAAAAKSKGKAPANPAASVRATPGESGPTVIRQADVDIDSLLAGIKEVDFDYDRERQARDPMAPLVGKVSKMAAEEEKPQNVPPATVGQVLNKVVTGIVWDPKTPVAVVDNDVVYPGYEYADGTTVVSIERDRVVFKVGDSPIEVKLKEL